MHISNFTQHELTRDMSIQTILIIAQYAVQIIHSLNISLKFLLTHVYACKYSSALFCYFHVKDEELAQLLLVSYTMYMYNTPWLGNVSTSEYCIYISISWYVLKWEPPFLFDAATSIVLYHVHNRSDSMESSSSLEQFRLLLAKQLLTSEGPQEVTVTHPPTTACHWHGLLSAREKSVVLSCNKTVHCAATGREGRKPPA